MSQAVTRRILTSASQTPPIVARLFLFAVCVFSLFACKDSPAQSPSGAQPLPDAPLSTGTITGIITDVTGALIAGAKVTLQTGNTTRSTVSLSDGSFALDNIPAGSFTITAAMTGFNASSVTGTLSAGQTYDVPSLSMKMAEVDVSVNALSQKQLAQLQVHAEEQQRVLGVLPNFFVAYDWKAVPLTPKQKFSLVAANLRDPINILIAAAASGVQQATNEFPGYEQGAEGYAKRFGANYANLAVGSTLGGGVYAVLFHQDPRYFYKGTGSVRSRLLYSLSSSVICRGDNGKRQPAYASMLGDFSASAVSNAYYPASDRQGAALTLGNGLLFVGEDAIANVFQEFIVRRFTPKSRRGVLNAITTESEER